jgi:hypothetical protein
MAATSSGCDLMRLDKGHDEWLTQTWGRLYPKFCGFEKIHIRKIRPIRDISPRVTDRRHRISRMPPSPAGLGRS